MKREKSEKYNCSTKLSSEFSSAVQHDGCSAHSFRLKIFLTRTLPICFNLLSKSEGTCLAKMFSLTTWNQFHCISKDSNLPSLHCFIPRLWQNPVTNFTFSQRRNMEKQPADLHLLIRIKLQLSRDHRLHCQLQPTLP